MKKPPHQVSRILDHEDSRVMRVTLSDGGIFRLRDFEQVDPSIYGDTDRWCARVEEAVAGTPPDLKRLYPPGSLVDLHESDISQVLDESSGQVCYHATPAI